MRIQTEYTPSRLELVKGERRETFIERHTALLLVALLLLAGLAGGIAG